VNRPRFGRNMTTIPNQKPNRRSIRLQGYDYASAGAYFITICTEKRKCLLGDIVNGQMVLNDLGRVVSRAWEWLGKQYDYVETVELVVMPNHLHGVIIINDESTGGSRTAPTEQAASRKPIGGLVGAFKTVSTKGVNSLRGTPGVPVWQRNYYEHIIRNDDDMTSIRQYIQDNPAGWEKDPEYSAV
jgi:putative transposase